ncbi:14107_t:CDS:2, partial [Funneliformis caledonium]
MLALGLGQVPNYTATNNANANTFVDAQKCDILKSKMGNKFSPVIANDSYID